VLVVTNLYKSKSARFPGEPVTHDIYRIHGNSSLGEPVVQIRFGCLVREVPNEQLCHPYVTLSAATNNL
jgi:hypothetical protein